MRRSSLCAADSLCCTPPPRTLIRRTHTRTAPLGLGAAAKRQPSPLGQAAGDPLHGPKHAHVPPHVQALPRHGPTAALSPDCDEGALELACEWSRHGAEDEWPAGLGRLDLMGRPRVPVCASLFLQDLRFVADGNDKQVEGLWSVDRMRRIADIALEVCRAGR